MSPLATEPFGVALFAMVTLALLALATVTMAVALLPVRFGTILLAVAVSVSAMLVPDAVLELTCSVSVKFAVALTAKVLAVQLMVPAAPTAGVVQIQPVAVIAWKLVLGGVGCEKVSVVAAAGPLLVTLWE